MFFSDDMAAVGYMIAYLLLGELPWSHAKSVEEIIAQKQGGELRAQIDEYPELVAFLDSFEKVDTDDIDYEKWIQLFSKAAAKCGNKSEDLLLPFVNSKSVVKRTQAVKEKRIVKEKPVTDKKLTTRKKSAMNKKSTVNRALAMKSQTRSIDALSKKDPKNLAIHNISSKNTL